MVIGLLPTPSQGLSTFLSSEMGTALCDLPTLGPQPSPPPHVNQVLESSLGCPLDTDIGSIALYDSHSVMEGLALHAVCLALGSGSRIFNLFIPRCRYPLLRVSSGHWPSP